MSRKKLDQFALALEEEVLASSGSLSLATLLTRLLSVQELRLLAREHGVTPKGGYRMDRAPAKVLVPLLAETKTPEVLEAVCAAVAQALQPKSGGTEGKAKSKAAATEDLAPMLELKEQELQLALKEVTKLRATATRQRRRLDALNQTHQVELDRAALLKVEVEDLRRQAARQTKVPAARKKRSHTIHELERELEAMEEINEHQRRKLAEKSAAIKELKSCIIEMQPLLAKVKGKRKRAEETEAPPLPDRFRIPYFKPGFIKSLEGKERRSVESAYQAILLFCTEGPSYPGLQVKQLEAASVWSFRAGIKLRVYFMPREDGDIDLVALADRQEQKTMLRRLKDLS